MIKIKYLTKIKLTIYLFIINLIIIFVFTKTNIKMKNINGTQYISVKEYAQMAGVSNARVSQMKADLPFEKFEDLGVELINYDLLKLSESQELFSKSHYQTSIPIHTYTYKDLGNFFAKFSLDLISQRNNAETLTKEYEEKINSLKKENERLEGVIKLDSEISRDRELADKQLIDDTIKDNNTLSEINSSQIQENKELLEKCRLYEVRLQELKMKSEGEIIDRINKLSNIVEKMLEQKPTL